MKIKFLSTLLIAAFTAFQVHAATTGKTLPTEPYVVDGYTPDTRTAEAKETYANRVVKSDVEGNNHSVFGQDNTVEAIHGSTSVYGNQNVVKVNAKDGNIFGDGSSIDGYQSQAIGDNNHLSGEQLSAVGMNNIVTGNHSHAYGGGNNITGDQVTAVGHYNLVKGNNATAIGYDNKVLSNEGTGVGERVEVSGLNASAFGSLAKATAESALALGSGSQATADSAVAVGNDSVASQKSSVAVGQSSKADGVFATALGDSSNALANGSVAISVDSQAKGINSMAMGRNALTTHDNSVALGSDSVSKIEKPVNEATVQSITYSGFAGNTPVATVSVGSEGKERQLVNVGAGEISATSTDAINGSQLYDTALEAQKHNTVVDGVNTTVTSKDNDFGRKEYKVNVNKTLKDMDAVEFGKITDDKRAIINKDGVQFFNGSENINVKPTGIQIENTDTLTQATFNGGGMQASDDNATIRFTTTDISVGGQQIHDVKAGTKDTDAVNVKQLNDKASSLDKAITYNTFNINKNAEKIGENANNITKNASDIKDLGDKVNKNTSDIKSLDDKINVVGEGAVVKANNYTDKQVAKVGANAAALSALHPLSFNANEKVEYAVGYGNYKGSNAVAVGMFAHPNENTLLSFGATFGTGDNMINAGATFRIGKSSKQVTNTNTAVAKDVQDLAKKYEALAQKYDNLVKHLNAVEGTDFDVEYPDVPKTHWAYDFVKDLSDKGFLVGYTDGTYKGDKAMTRYEFATALYRALQRGAVMDANMVKAIKEFEPELKDVEKAQRFVVVRESGSDNEIHKVERVQVNTQYSEHTYRDAYGTELK
nr:MAG TPA: hypothetical protein [Caudoviricetes sp.]